MTVVGVDLSTLRVDLAWIDDSGRPQRWHQVIGDPKARAKKTEDVIDSLRRIRVQWPRVGGIEWVPGQNIGYERGAVTDVTDVCIEYPRGQNHEVTAKLAAVAGVITRQAPTWARVAWIDSRDLRKAIGAKNTKVAAVTALLQMGDLNIDELDDWNEHEWDALVACVAWTKILEAQETVTMTTPDGKTTDPVPLSALEDARTRQLTLFEGQRYPDCKIALSGGVEGLTADLDDFTGLCVGDTFSATIRGVVVSKPHAVKFDEDGCPERTLTVTLKADDVRPAS